MQKFIIVAITGLGLLGVSQLICRAEDKTGNKTDEKANIVALYKKLEMAEKTISTSGTLELLAPGFKYKNGDGKIIDGKQFTDQMQKQMSMVKAVKEMKLIVTKVVFKGKTAHVTDSYSWKMDIIDEKGRMGEPGITHTLASIGSVENDVIKTDKGWKFMTLQTSTGHMTLDGKPYPPSAASLPTKSKATKR